MSSIPTLSTLSCFYNDGKTFNNSKTSLKRVRDYSYDIILASLRSYRIDEQIKINGLKRGRATSQGNNCLLHSIFQQLPIEIRGDFSVFTVAIRTRIEKTNQELLSINDEQERTQIFSAIQAYLREESRTNYYFNLTVIFADNDGDLAYVGVGGIEQTLDRSGNSINLKIIVVNYCHYEPLFDLDDVDHLALGLEEFGLEERTSDSSGSSELNVTKVALPSYVVNILMKVDSDEEAEESSDEENIFFTQNKEKRFYFLGTFGFSNHAWY